MRGCLPFYGQRAAWSLICEESAQHGRTPFAGKRKPAFAGKSYRPERPSHIGAQERVGRNPVAKGQAASYLW